MRSFRKYFAFASMAWKSELQDRGSIFGRLALYLLIIAAFQQIWIATAQSNRLGFTIDQMVWYLMITEWITLSVPRNHMLRMEEEARDGSLAYFLMRPVSFVAMRMAEGIGATMISFCINGICGCSFAFLLTRSCPLPYGWFFLLMPIAILAVILELLLETIIALSAFWLYESRPFFWIYQKFMFVLGGLLFPLEIYPHWMQTIAWSTPFPVMLYGTALMALHPSLSQGLLNLALLIFWMAIVVALLLFGFEHCRKQIEVGGG